VDYVATNSDWDDEDSIEHLMASGFSKSTAENAVRFTGVAFGRLLLNELGVELSNEYVLFRADGSAAESAELDHSEAFREATRLASELSLHPGFKPLAHSSPEVDAVNQSLEAGSNPEDQVIGPVALFLDRPTPAGLQVAEEGIIRLAKTAAKMSPNESAGRVNKPWWKF
jgi:hypothetical protein